MLSQNELQKLNIAAGVNTSLVRADEEKSTPEMPYRRAPAKGPFDNFLFMSRLNRHKYRQVNTDLPQPEVVF